MNRMTDIQEICNYLKLVWKHPMNVSKQFQKISHSEPDIWTNGVSGEGCTNVCTTNKQTEPQLGQLKQDPRSQKLSPSNNQKEEK